MFSFLLMAAGLTLSTNLVPGNTGLVLVDCGSGEVSRVDGGLCGEALPPCSTFKIWNAAIGLELGELSRADEPFWTWDGSKQAYPIWEKDLNLKEAFAASCVPAFQALARKTGKERMQLWLDKLGYGDRDMSAGVDQFWLPAHSPKRTILISADAQAELLRKLVRGELPLSPHTLAVLKDVMFIETTAKGSLYGKTGTSGSYVEPDGTNRVGVGWFVGYVVSGGKTFSFACVMKKKGVVGKDARAVVERTLEEKGLL